jgi:hypothetical protein
MAQKMANRILVDGAKSRCINCKQPIVYRIKEGTGEWLHSPTLTVPCTPGYPLMAKPERTFHPPA